jgi:general nucleoside transport system ATP-binding protein
LDADGRAEPWGSAISARSITKRFPGVLANDEVNLDVSLGEVHALLGENGAGKSTLSNILTGLYRPDSGELYIGGERVTLRSPQDAIARRVAMVHQQFRLIPVFTVAQNVLLGERGGIRLNRRKMEQRVRDLGEHYGLPVDPNAYIWQLSVGEQQRVEILKALHREAQTLILDEPTAVLTPQEAEALFATMRQMAGEQRAVIFISHKLNEVLAVADTVTVLRGGRSVATRPTAGATAQDLASLMVGRDILATRSEASTSTATELALQVTDLSAQSDRGQESLHSVSLDVRVGEIMVLVGVAGNGQREFVECITGLRKARAGSVRVNGNAVRLGDARAAIAMGIAHIPEDRLGTGVSPSLSIAENLALTSYRSGRGPFLPRSANRARAVALMEQFDIRAPGPDTPARQLSGGNLQKVVLAREFSSNPKVIVAASPTRGLDVGAIETVHGHLRSAATGGAGVLLVSEDLDEALALGHRIAVMHDGRIVGQMPVQEATRDRLGLLMAGAEAAA